AREFLASGCARDPGEGRAATGGGPVGGTLGYGARARARRRGGRGPAPDCWAASDGATARGRRRGGRRRRGRPARLAERAGFGTGGRARAAGDLVHRLARIHGIVRSRSALRRVAVPEPRRGSGGRGGSGAPPR